jgi:predicted aldo/keto reductase-like oxidoreductase
MQYRRFGKTNLELSVFSLGTMRCLGSPDALAATVEAALHYGINHLETARGYGQSEIELGQVLQQQGWRDRVYVTTKITPTPTAADLERAIEESLQRLQTDYLDSLAIHGINTWNHLEWVTRTAQPVLNQVQADGRVRHVGFSTHGSLDLIKAAIATEQFAFVNLHYGFFFQRNAPAIAWAQQQDLGVFIISPADKGGMLYTPPPALVDLCRPLSPLGMNYRFLLSDPRITTLSVGPAQPQELDQPMTFADAVGGLTAAEQQVFERLQQQQERLGSDLCQQCYQCLPCPEHIPIPDILRLRNLTLAYEMQAFGEYRYGMLERAGHWFPGNKGHRCTDCGECLPRCPEHLPIPQLLRDAHGRLNGQPRRRLWEN